MADQNHPIAPPSELVDQWRNSKILLKDALMVAAQWGADQELEACCEYVKQWFAAPQHRIAELRNARRPKPSLKARLTEAIQNDDLETALKLVEGLDDSL